MPDPLRLLVHKRLTTLLEGITYVDVDESSVSMVDRVFRGRGIFGTETPVPLISILEAPIPNETERSPTGGTSIKQDWELVIQGFVKDDKRNPTDPAHVLMAEVKKALIDERKKQDWHRPEDGILGLGRSILDLVVGAGVVRPADELSSKAYFWLVLTVKMVEDLSDPYGGQ